MAAISTAALLGVTQIVLRAPVAILYGGAVTGMVNALTAAGIILIYRTLKVINFSQAAIGAAGGVLTFTFMQYTSLPFVIAFVLGLLLSGIVGAIVGVVSIRFSRAPRLVLSVFTIVLAQFLATSSSYILKLPWLPPTETLDLSERLGGVNFQNRMPLGGFKYQIGGLPLPFGFAEILAVEVGVVALLGVAFFFRYTRAGTAVRAVAENSERASLLGIGVGSLSVLIWALAGLLSGAGVTMNGLLNGPGVASAGGITILLPALAAAVIGRMRSLPITVAGAVGISILNEAWNWRLRDDRPAFDALLFLVIAFGLLIQRRVLLRSEQQSETTSWVASQEPRPIPRELLAVPGVRVARIALIGVALIVLALYPFAVGTGATVLGAVIAINAIVVVSLVVLTGWAGQVSLGQFAFVGLGAVVAGAFSTQLGLPFLIAVPAATLVVAAFATLVGLPALRIPGLFLLVVTFGFALAVRSVLFNERYFGWLLIDSVDRPRFLILDFEDERSMYYLCAAALVLAILVVKSLRASRIGRLLIALRESENNVRAFGVSAVGTKILAFAVSGGLAGFAGAVFIFQQRGLSADSYSAEASIQVFQQGVFGGIASVTGALLGSAYFNIQTYMTDSTLAILLAGPFTTLALLYGAPGGLISLVTKARDGILKIIAQRRQLIVPSLFADMDQTALELQLWPLAEPMPSFGLATLPVDRRFTLKSDLYGENGSVPDGSGQRTPEPETPASTLKIPTLTEEESA